LVCGSVVLILATSYTNCFALRIWDKTQSVAVRIALILLPAYYALLIWQNGFSINIWTVCGIQLLIAIAFVYISLRMKVYEDGKQKQHTAKDFSWSKYSIDLLPFVRTKRVKTQLMVFLLIFFLQLYLVPHRQVDFDMFLMAYVVCGAGLVSQFHFAIEANYWNLLETQTNGVKSIFERKFEFIFWLQMVVMLTCAPLTLIYDISIMSIIAVNFLAATFFNIIQLVSFMMAKRLDLWGAVMFNYQGSNMACSFYYFVLFLVFVLEYNGYYMAEYAISFGLGVLSLIFKDRIFDEFYSMYRKHKYEIAARFQK
jgi:hypothetical protein